MNIAIFSDTFPPQINGVANVVALSEKSLRKRGHNVQIFTASDSMSFPFLGYPGERVALPTGSIYKKVKSFNPDVIHTHTPFGVGWEAVWSAHFLDVPLVGTHHTFFDQYLKHVHFDFDWSRELSWKYVAKYYNNCDIITSPSNVLIKDMLANGAQKKIIYLPNAVDTGFFSPAAKAVRFVLKDKFGIRGLSAVYMGRLSYEKSIEQVIKAFSLVEKKISDASLLIIGDGPEKAKLQEQCAKLGLQGVIFTGVLRGQVLVSALQAADVFVSASKSENMPLSILEAMATGLPVVGVRALGIPEIVEHEKNGFIVSPDSPKELAEKISELLLDEKLRTKFSANSRERALSFGEEEITRQLEEIYRSAISGFKASHNKNKTI
ncbi:MAG: glycosyltransferase [Parcubacteria group bacterium]